MLLRLLTYHWAKRVLFFTTLLLGTVIGIDFILCSSLEIKDTGLGEYNIAAATLFLLLNIPHKIQVFLPWAFSLGVVATIYDSKEHNELIAIQGFGVSNREIRVAIFKIIIICLLFNAPFMAFVVPAASAKRNQLKSFALSSGKVLLSKKGTWIKDNNKFIYWPAHPHINSTTLIFGHSNDGPIMHQLMEQNQAIKFNRSAGNNSITVQVIPLEQSETINNFDKLKNTFLKRSLLRQIIAQSVIIAIVCYASAAIALHLNSLYFTIGATLLLNFALQCCKILFF